MREPARLAGWVTAVLIVIEERVVQRSCHRLLRQGNRGYGPEDWKKVTSCRAHFVRINSHLFNTHLQPEFNFVKTTKTNCFFSPDSRDQNIAAHTYFFLMKMMIETPELEEDKRKNAENPQRNIV